MDNLYVHTVAQSTFFSTVYYCAHHSRRHIVPASLPLHHQIINMLYLSIIVFDAYGKPTTGIRRGVLYFAGTYDQCMTVRASVPVNVSLGQYHVVEGEEVNFGGKYCRATFNPPQSLIAGVAGDHINVSRLQQSSASNALRERLFINTRQLRNER